MLTSLRATVGQYSTKLNKTHRIETKPASAYADVYSFTGRDSKTSPFSASSISPPLLKSSARWMHILPCLYKVSPLDVLCQGYSLQDKLPSIALAVALRMV